MGCRRETGAASRSGQMQCRDQAWCSDPRSGSVQSCKQTNAAPQAVRRSSASRPMQRRKQTDAAAEADRRRAASRPTQRAVYRLIGDWSALRSFGSQAVQIDRQPAERGRLRHATPSRLPCARRHLFMDVQPQYNWCDQICSIFTRIIMRVKRPRSRALRGFVFPEASDEEPFTTDRSGRRTHRA